MVAGKEERKREEQEEDKKEEALDEKVREAEAKDGEDVVIEASASKKSEDIEQAVAKGGAEDALAARREGGPADARGPEIEKLESQVARQTDSRGLAEMLGSLEMDIYRLKDQVDKVKAEVKDGVRLRVEDPETNMFYPIATSLRCVLALAALYFVVYTAMILCKVFTEAFNLGDSTRCEISLRAACEMVFYAPMLCVIFLGAQLRAEQITEGRGGPSLGAETAMQVCVWSMLVQTLLVLAVPVLTNGAEVALLDEEGGAKLPELPGHALSGVLSLVRYAALVSLLLGLSVVCCELVMMDARSLRVEPPDLWDDPTTKRTEYAPPLSPATKCSIALMVLFFLVYVARAVLRSCLDLSSDAGEEGEGSRYCVAVWEKCLETCSGTMNLAPMLCILFMAARVRALQVEPKLGQLPIWAEQSLFGCASALALHVCIVVLAWTLGIQTSVGSANSIVDEARHSRIASGISRPDLSAGDSGDRFIIPMRTPLGQKLVLLGRGLALAATYTCAVLVAASIFLAHAPAGRPTPPTSPAVRCAVAFALLYLAVHLLLFFTQAFAVLTLSFGLIVPPRHTPLLLAVRCLRMAEYTVKLCPMAAALFLAARLRAVQLGGQGGASPQCWAQEAMFSAAMALAVQLAAVLGAAWLAPAGVEVDETCGSPSAKKVAYVPGRVLLETLKFCTFVALYGSLVAVGASVLAIRPETAHCSKLGAYVPFLAGLEG